MLPERINLHATGKKDSRREFLRTNLGRALIVAGVLSASKQVTLGYLEHANGLRHTNVTVPVGPINKHANVTNHVNGSSPVHENTATHTNGLDHANTSTHVNGTYGCPNHSNALVHANVVQGHTNKADHTNKV